MKRKKKSKKEDFRKTMGISKSWVSKNLINEKPVTLENWVPTGRN